MEATRNLCAQIPASLHDRVREERESLGQSLSEYVTQILREHFEGGKSNCTVIPAPCHHDTGSNFPPEDFRADRRSLKSYVRQDKFKISLSLTRRNNSG